jgi:Tfp pilus assembly protein PilO
MNMSIIDSETRRFGRLLHYAGLLATVVCASIGYSWVHAPTMEAIDDTSARIQELNLLVKNTPLMRAQHRKVSEKLSEVTTRITEVQRRVPRDADAGGFLKQVTKLASEEQFSIQDFTPEKPVDREGYAEMQVTLKGAGTYASICTFLDRLSKLKRLSKVKDLTLTAEGDADEYPLTATFVIYFALRSKEADSLVPPAEGRRG